MKQLRKFTLRFYYSKLGQTVWKGLSKVLNIPIIKIIIMKALDVNKNTADEHVFDSKYYILPKIIKSESKKNALIIMPFYGCDAVGKNIDLKIRSLKELGYTIHAVVYNDSPWKSNSEDWDYTYNVKAQHRDFGKLSTDTNNNIIPDGNGIDDWIGDELIQFLYSLSNINVFDICLVNYVFLSKACDVFNSSTVTIIDTHDVFANRNSKMSDVGVKPENFYFSTDKKSEFFGLSRADYIFAIQEEEGEYFRCNLGNKVLVQPPILEKNYIKYNTNLKNKLIVGFLASGHYPNVMALLNFLKSFNKTLSSENIEVRVAGTICSAIERSTLPNFVNVIGFADDLAEFYGSCDVIINPDELKSGMKVKCLEALSFACPLISTKSAMAGIESKLDYHNLDSSVECAKAIVYLSQNKSVLAEMSKQSIEIFDCFSNKYDFKSTMRSITSE